MNNAQKNILLSLAIYVWLLLHSFYWPTELWGSPDGFPIRPEELQKQIQIPHCEVLPEYFEGLRLDTFFENTGVRIVVPTQEVAFGKYRCNVPTSQNLREHVSSTVSSLSLYPKSFLRKARTRYVLLCGELHAQGLKIGGIGAGAVGVILVDTDYYRSIADFERALHHELYHMVDFAEDRSFTDPEWEELNPNGFRYETARAPARLLSSQIGSGKEGFITAYSTSGVQEDKAELFSRLITNHREVTRMTMTDAVLEKKVRLMKERLHRFSPEMNDEFWGMVR